MNHKNRKRNQRFSLRLQHIRRGNPDNVLREVSLISTTSWDRDSGTANVALGLFAQLLNLQEGEAIEILQNDHSAPAREWQQVDGLE